MHWVGNDVVDLDDESIAGHHQNRRFIARVLAEPERARLESCSEMGAKKTFLWSLYAAKEAAYKAVEKLRGPTIFAHRSFVVAPDARSVRHLELALSLEVTEGVGFVHAVAFTGDVPPRTAIERIPEEADPSGEARRLLCKAIAESLGCSFEDLTVVRDEAPGSWTGRGPPRVLLRGAPIELDVSLSHDGRFVAAAAAGVPIHARTSA